MLGIKKPSNPGYGRGRKRAKSHDKMDKKVYYLYLNLHDESKEVKSQKTKLLKSFVSGIISIGVAPWRNYAFVSFIQPRIYIFRGIFMNWLKEFNPTIGNNCTLRGCKDFRRNFRSKNLILRSEINCTEPNQKTPFNRILFIPEEKEEGEGKVGKEEKKWEKEIISKQKKPHAKRSSLYRKFV